MREIRFKAWDKKDKIMHSTAEVGLNGLKFFEIIESKRYELMQFTGLKDENGKDIYEGDIVTCKIEYNKTYIKHIGKIVFENGCFIVASKTMVDEYMTFIELQDDWEIEIIGYENPELLEEK